jgi:hypothetical protein
MAGMGFMDLPEDWPDRRLREPRLVADVLDLVVRCSDRHAGGLAVLMCDLEGRLLQPVMVGELESGLSEDDYVQMVGTFAELMAGSGSLLLAIARRDGLSLTADDRAWCRAACRACSAAGVELLGFHVVTMSGSREVPADIAA